MCVNNDVSSHHMTSQIEVSQDMFNGDIMEWYVAISFQQEILKTRYHTMNLKMLPMLLQFTRTFDDFSNVTDT